MSVRCTKPWETLDAQALERVPGQLGVFEFASDAGEILFIGRADARTAFGLRSEIARQADAMQDARLFRYEVTTAYHTRHLELLMAHRADHARLPRHNAPMPTLGRLSPG